MAVEIKIPVPDQVTKEVRIVKWHKAEGEAVKKGEVVLEVETDKSVIEVEASADGVLLKRLAGENDSMPVGEIIAYVGLTGEAIESRVAGRESRVKEKAGDWRLEAGGKGEVVRSQESVVSSEEERVKISPMARKLAEKHNIAFSKIRGSGPGGRIVREDIELAVETGGKEESRVTGRGSRVGEKEVVRSQESGVSSEERILGGTPKPQGGRVEIKVPIPDQVTKEVRIVKWRKEEGEGVRKGEVVLEVETDKSVIEVEAAGEGVLLQKAYQENDAVPVGEVVGYIGGVGEIIESRVSGPDSEKEVVSSQEPGVSKEEARSQKTEVRRKEGERILASPNARRLARELGVDLARVRGTGPGGRIVGEDVRKAKEAGGYGLEAGGRKEESRVAGRESRVEEKAKVEGPKVPAMPQAGTEAAVTRMRRAIGLNLQASSRDIPHFRVTMPVDMTRAMAARERLNAGKAKEERISVNDLVVKAVAEGLRVFTAVNSRLSPEGDRIIYHGEVNVGVATAVADGLVVPVLTRANERSWDELAAETKRIAAEARKGKIIGAGKGTFTISNLGMFGVEEFTAIINPPESAILAVGAVRDEVVAAGGMIGIRPMMRLTLCSDHRVIDGALAAAFLQWVKWWLEQQI